MSVMELTVATGDPLSVRRFHVREAVSEPWDITVLARTSDPSLDLDSIVGRPASFQLVSGVAGVRSPERRWSGICRYAEQEQAEPTGLSTYRFLLSPTLWLLTQRRDHRIVQHRSAPAIAAGILEPWKIRHALSIDAAGHPSLPYKVQYGESDYAFFCRICEEAGIAFTFPEDDAGHAVLTLGDRLSSGTPRSPALPYEASPNEAAEQELVTDVRLFDQGRPGALELRDHDMRRPSYPLDGDAPKAAAPEDAWEQYHYQPGVSLVETSPSGDTPAADAEGAARNDDAEIRRRAQRWLEADRADKREVAYRTNVLDLWPGRVFSVSGHPHPDLAQSLLATELTLEGAPGEAWTFLGRAMIADQPYRPPLRTPRPRARVQSATVVGPEEIHTDEYGRVRVCFPWDRGAGTSTWIRVSHGWAGAGYGMMALPRVGQEVLVDFLDGDPEQPVVVGRVFNQTNPVIERLPERETRSAWKSHSSPASAGFNELLFEDQKGSELVYVQAERDARRLVKHDDTSTIGHDRKKEVAISELETTGHDRAQETRRDWVELTYGDRTTVVGATRRDRVDREAVERIETEQVVYAGQDQHAITAGVRRESVELESHLHIGGNRPERVGRTDALGVHESLLESVGSYSVIASGIHAWIHHMAGGPGGKIVIETDGEVTLRGAGGFITIDSGGVTIVGQEVIINEGGAPADLFGVGPPRPEPPRMAIVDEPPPPRDPDPNDPRVSYELVVLDEWEKPLAGLTFMVTTPAGTTAEITDQDGRIQVDGPPERASAYAGSPADIAGLVAGREAKVRRSTPLPTGDPWVIRTPTDLADTVVLPQNEPQKLIVVTRTDLAHHAYGSLWTGYALANGGPYQMKSASPVLVQMQADATQAQAVVVGHHVTTPGGATGTQRSAREEAAMPAAPGETPEGGPEWLRAVVDALHDGLVKGAFDAVFTILASIPPDPPEPPRPALPDPAAERAAYQAALAALASQGVVDPTYVEDPSQP